MLHALELAAFESWPSLEQETHAGWLLRFAKGYTKRANSANALHNASALSEDIEEMERRFRARDLPPTFRLTSDPASQAADEQLVLRGYRLLDPSYVMCLPLTAPRSEIDIVLLDDLDAWLAAFRDISGKTGAGQGIHRQILQHITHPRSLAVCCEAGLPVSCGLGVLVDGHLGLFDLATRLGYQRRGLATRLCQGLMHWGRDAGATTAYLQVFASNIAAIRLYERLGFRQLYHYWYRIKA
ncbi:GNAT family N-acetyltransferase [Candidatus Dactylopiibacterium carminicum]|nr:GNAT family N-acetyltransferase [Candidatus Dactylopiibacterium carminicum]